MSDPWEILTNEEPDGSLSVTWKANDQEQWQLILQAFKQTIPQEGRRFDRRKKVWYVAPGYHNFLQDFLSAIHHSKLTETTMPFPIHAPQPGYGNTLTGYVVSNCEALPDGIYIEAGAINNLFHEFDTSQAWAILEGVWPMTQHLFWAAELLDGTLAIRDLAGWDLEIMRDSRFIPNEVSEMARMEIERQMALTELRCQRLWFLEEGGGYVYVILSPATGLYKIGWTGDLRKRIQTLRSATPGGVRPICAMITAEPRATEKALQEHFGHKRVNGEWFELADEDVQWIKQWRLDMSDVYDEGSDDFSDPPRGWWKEFSARVEERMAHEH